MGRFMPTGACKPKEKGLKSMSAPFPMRTRAAGKLSRFADGFESSRIGFAFQNLGDVKRQMGSMIFDESFPGWITRKLFCIGSIIEVMGIAVDGFSPTDAR